MWAVRNATGFYFNHRSICCWRTLQIKKECKFSLPWLLGEEHWQWLMILLHWFCTTLTTLGKDLFMAKFPYSLAEKVWSKGWFSGATLETYQCKLGHGGETTSGVSFGGLPPPRRRSCENHGVPTVAGCQYSLDAKTTYSKHLKSEQLEEYSYLYMVPVRQSCKHGKTSFPLFPSPTRCVKLQKGSLGRPDRATSTEKTPDMAAKIQ